MPKLTRAEMPAVIVPAGILHRRVSHLKRHGRQILAPALQLGKLENNFKMVPKCTELLVAETHADDFTTRYEPKNQPALRRLENTSMFLCFNNIRPALPSWVDPAVAQKLFAPYPKLPRPPCRVGYSDPRVGNHNARRAGQHSKSLVLNGPPFGTPLALHRVGESNA